MEDGKLSIYYGTTHEGLCAGLGSEPFYKPITALNHSRYSARRRQTIRRIGQIMASLRLDVRLHARLLPIERL